MIIEIPNENSIVKWKNDDKDEWKVAEIFDLIKAYERPQGEWLEMKRKIDNRHSVFIFKCPFCGYIEKCKANFCGKCGAEMKMRTTAD